MDRESATAQGEGAYALPAPRRRIARSFRRRGVFWTCRECFSWGYRFLSGPAWAKRERSTPEFVLGGHRYRYLDHWHSWTWLNERAVELPLARSALELADPERTIEIGNVTRHYFPAQHRVVDKYEEAPGVENLDLFAITERGSYDLVLSISTLEHVGWDEPVPDPDAALEAVSRLRELTAPGGRLLVTIPVGYHPRLTAAAVDGSLGFDSVRALRCQYPSAEWFEVEPSTASSLTYDELLYRAQAVLICDWNKP